DSVTNTGTCFCPSCTAIVWPTISGKMVEVRDQVLTICFALPAFMASMRASSRSSTHGPFLEDLLIACSFPGPCARGGVQDRAGQERSPKAMPAASSRARTPIQRRYCAASVGAWAGEGACSSLLAPSPAADDVAVRALALLASAVPERGDA